MIGSLLHTRQATTFFHQNIEGSGLNLTIAESFDWIRALTTLINNYGQIKMQDAETMQTHAVHFAFTFTRYWVGTLEGYQQVKFSVALARMLMQSREITAPVVDFNLTKNGEAYTLHMN